MQPCTIEAAALVKRGIKAASGSKTAIEKFPVEMHTSIAAVSWLGEQRLFVQGIDGTIRQASRKDDQSWRGGGVGDAIATGKLCTPIAATAWQHEDENGQPAIRVYFLDEGNYIRERTWDPKSEWADGSLPRTFKAAPLSQLAVTSWTAGNIMLFYQCEDGTIQPLHGWADRGRWEPGPPVSGASTGCSLSVISYMYEGSRSVRFYFQSEDSEYREACWDRLHDDDRNYTRHQIGYYRFGASLGSSVSSIVQTAEEHLELRVYTGGEHGISERRSYNWGAGHTVLEDLLPKRHISALRTDSGSVNIYLVQGDGLVEVQHSPERTTSTRILPNSACCGVRCPENWGRQVPPTHGSDGLQEPRIAESTSEKVLSRPSSSPPSVYSSTNINSVAITGSSNVISESRSSKPTTASTDDAFRKDGDPNSHPVKTLTDAVGEDSDLQDTATIYSDVSGADMEMINSYVSEFVDGVLEALRPAILGRESLHRSSRIEEVLPGLLKDFAFRFGHDSQSQDRRNIVFFTHRHSSKIATHLAKQWRLAEVSDADDPDPKPDPALEEIKTVRVGDWLAESQAIAEEPPEAPDIVDDPPEIPDQDEEGSLESLDSEYWKLILASPAYQWLLASLRREVVLNLEDSSSMVKIRKAIAFPRHISAKRSVKIFSLTFHITWDPTKFVKDQQYREKPEDAIYKAITLTGAAENAQALTTSQYLLQTWPTTGQQMLQLIQAMVAGEPHEKLTCSLPEGTVLTAWVELSEGEHSRFLIEASGTSSALQEVGEQLGWISAALRSSRSESITFCAPKVVSFRRRPAGVPEDIPRFDCDIEHTFRSVDENTIPINGQCWHNLFRNPVVIEGFPIPLRTERDTGLEIPLNVIAALADTKRVDEFNRKYFIKGFATMLYPTKRSEEDVVIWHLQCRKDGERISYFEVHEPHIDVPISVLETARHIVGWCSEAELVAGSPKAKYDVRRPQLPRPSDDCVLQNISVSGGKIITGGFNIAIGVKDQPIHVTRSGYVPLLEWIHQKFAVFWDEEHKRGWLVNGTTALLHLVRSAWKAKEKGPFKDALLNKSEALKEAPEENTTTFAIGVLMNEQNQQLNIYRDGHEDGKTKYFRFEDLVDQLYNIVEKMIDHHSSAASRSGMSLKCRARHHIDGWDFNDVISERDCNPAVATLQSMGKGWVHLVNDIGAVIFLGRGFGEVIKPTSAAGCCKHWAQLPTDCYYLGVCVSDLVQIIESYGNNDCTEPRKLSKSISWPNAEDRFRRCECGRNQDHSDLSQMLQSSRECKPLLGDKELTANGAVIFRHNIELTGLSFSRILARDRRVISASRGLQIPHDSVIGSSQSQSPAQSSAGDHLHSGQSSCDAAPLEPSLSSAIMNGTSQPAASDEDTHHRPEMEIVQGVVTEAEFTAVELGLDSTAQSREGMPNTEAVGHDVCDTPRNTNDGEAVGGEIEGGNNERQSWQEAQRDEEMVQGNSDASRNTNDKADLGQNIGRRSRFKQQWKKLVLRLSGKG